MQRPRTAIRSWSLGPSAGQVQCLLPISLQKQDQSAPSLLATAASELLPVCTPRQLSTPGSSCPQLATVLMYNRAQNNHLGPSPSIHPSCSRIWPHGVHREQCPVQSLCSFSIPPSGPPRAGSVGSGIRLGGITGRQGEFLLSSCWVCCGA